jgi:hypothetical protein
MDRRTNRSAAAESASPGRVVAVALFLLTALVSAVPGVSSPAQASAAGRQTTLPMQHPTAPRTRLACFDPKRRTYVGKNEPWHCEVAGNVAFAGHLEGEATENVGDGSFARFPIGGEFERIDWEGDWGTFKSYGESAIDARDGSRVKLIVNRRVRCVGGGTWYSRATVFNLDNGYNVVLRLPVCGDSL